MKLGCQSLELKVSWKPKNNHMETGLLYRDHPCSICNEGMLFISGEFFYTLELPWLNNVRNISCIPPDEYLCEFIEESNNKKFHDCYAVRNVPARAGVLIHNGNLVTHTHGCVLIGKARSKFLRQPSIEKSKSALSDLVYLMNKDSFILKIIGS
jgi:hypothetical protein